jgi:hypothetical protein
MRTLNERGKRHDPTDARLCRPTRAKLAPSRRARSHSLLAPTAAPRRCRARLHDRGPGRAGVAWLVAGDGINLDLVTAVAGQHHQPQCRADREMSARESLPARSPCPMRLGTMRTTSTSATATHRTETVSLVRAELRVDAFERCHSSNLDARLGCSNARRHGIRLAAREQCRTSFQSRAGARMESQSTTRNSSSRLRGVPASHQLVITGGAKFSCACGTPRGARQAGDPRI